MDIISITVEMETIGAYNIPAVEHIENKKEEIKHQTLGDAL